MKVKTMSALAGLGGALIMSSSANAAAQLVVVSSNTTNTFLTANNLQSAVVGVTGLAAGENLQGFLGTASTPWSITCSSGTFFNVASTTVNTSNPFNGMGQGAASSSVAQPGAAFDSGVLGSASGLGSITNGVGTAAIGFAQFGVGTSPASSDAFWLSLNPAGLPITTMNLFRLTWARNASATISMLCVTNTGGGNGNEVPVSLTIPAVPAPGAVALLGLAGLIGSRRRRA